MANRRPVPSVTSGERPVQGAGRRYDAPFARRLRHAGEYAIVRGLLAMFAGMSLDRASALGGALGRRVGPRLGITARARANLERAFPERDAAAREAIVAGMWENLGRVVAEFPHLNRLRTEARNRIQIVGVEHAEALRPGRHSAIFVGGHIGNWEILSIVAALMQLPLEQIYRPANNPLVDRLMRRFRVAPERHRPKGAPGARAAIAALKRHEHVGMLVDQKLNEGMPVPFFGHDAMTSVAPARLARRFGARIVPVRVERLHGAYFRLTLMPPLAVRRHDDEIARVTRTINETLENWIRDRPEQWLWLHRRWPREEGAMAAASDLRRARDRAASDTS